MTTQRTNRGWPGLYSISNIERYTTKDTKVTKRIFTLF